MGIAGSEFNTGDKVVLTLQGNELTGTISHTTLHRTLAFVDLDYDGTLIWIDPHENYIKRVEPSNQELWDAIELGEAFTFYEGGDEYRRVKITPDKYILLGTTEIYTWQSVDKPIKRSSTDDD